MLFWDISGLFQVSLTIRVLDLRVHYYTVHMQLKFQVDVQLDISLNYIEVAAIGLLYLILCSELAPND